jgi:hypothetical protein
LGQPDPERPKPVRILYYDGLSDIATVWVLVRRDGEVDFRFYAKMTIGGIKE